MPDIYHTFTVRSSAEQVFAGISTEKGLDNWWTKTSIAEAKLNGAYTLDFGSGYIWKAILTRFEMNKAIEWQLTEADPDWMKTRIGFLLTDKGSSTEVQFYQTGWHEATENYKISSYCWAMYLRILKHFIESGETVPYEKRLSV